MEPDPEQLPEVFIGRQPILDREQLTVGYELLFRSSHDNDAQVTNARAATADVVCKAFGQLGFATALGDRRAFINVDSEFVFDDAVELLPADTTVLELARIDAVRPDVVARCIALRQHGYEFSVTGIAEDYDELSPMLELASYARIDVIEHPPEALTKRIQRLRTPTRKLIASRVETLETKKAALDAGFDLFQGFYFARPIIIEGRKLDASTHTLIRLINLVNDDADTARIETAFKSEPALSINLLRLVNSVGMGLANKVTSIRQAVTVIGRKQLLRWLQLLLFSHGSDKGGIAANPLMQWAAMRGCFMELLAGRSRPSDRVLRDQAFLVGIMSLMPTALGMPMDEILKQIALVPDVHAALSKREGTLGMLLELTERYDNNDMDGAAAIFGHVGGRLTLQSLSLCLAEAITWVRQLCEDAA